MTNIRTISKTAAFGLNLLRLEAAKHSGKNILVAPAPLSLALGTVLTGARATTRKSMIEALGLEFDDNKASFKSLIAALSDDLGASLQIANAIWAQNGESFELEFLEQARTYFQTTVAQSDFANRSTVKKINSWCAEKTNSRITEIIEELSPLDTMLLFSGSCFKGRWKSRFDKALTAQQPFYAAGGVKQHPLMFQSIKTPVIDDYDWSAVALPFGDRYDRITFFAILPCEDKTITDVVNGLSEDSFRRLLHAKWPTKIDLYLPKFKMEYGESLNDSLFALGMTELLSPGADLSGLRKGAYLNRVIARTRASFSEDGSEPVGAVKALSLGRSPRLKFRIDRPFVWLVADKGSGALLFAGVVNDPEKVAAH